MRASLAELLAHAARRRTAVGAFTCYNLETALGVVQAAEAHGTGVVVLVSPASFRAPGGALLVSALAALVERAPVPACVQLDHVADLQAVEAAFEAGVEAVMADGSRLSYDENVELVRRAVEVAVRFGGHVEAELGRIEGDEDVAAATQAGALTEPDEAATFVERTGAACLAVSIGNVHGRYARPPALDWPRLQALRERVDAPLSLHGTSGLPEDDVVRAVALGVAKFNVNTELREAYLETTAQTLPRLRPALRVLDLNLAQADAVAEVVSARLRLCSPG